MRTIVLTAYQKHVRSFSKTWTGKPKNMMKAAARAWNKRTGAPKKKPRSSSPSKRRRKTVTKKKKRRSGGFRLPGGIGPKAALFGALGLTIAPMLLPVQSPGASKLGAGLAMRALKIGGGGPLAAVGIMELIAQFLGPVLTGGRLNLFGGNGGPAGGGVFDY